MSLRFPLSSISECESLFYVGRRFYAQNTSNTLLLPVRNINGNAGAKWMRRIFGTKADTNILIGHGRRASASCDLR